MQLKVEKLTLGYPQRHAPTRLLVENLTLAAPEGELIALLGRNGVGKSTLLRVLAGVRHPLAGQVTMAGENVATLVASERARRIAFVTTEPVTVAHLRVHEVVAMGRAPYTGWFGTLTEEDEARVVDSLERVGMAAFRDKPLDSLSDGERQRVMIARALAQDTPLMLLDEPTAFLDLPNRYQIALLLRDLAHETGKTILYSSHDLATALELCDTLWVMTPKGVAAGAPEDVLLSGALEEMFAGTPLTLTPQGVVQLKRSTRGTLRISPELEPAVALLVERTAARCGFRVLGPDTDERVDGVVGITGGGGLTLLRTADSTTVEAADFHALASLLRTLHGAGPPAI